MEKTVKTSGTELLNEAKVNSKSTKRLIRAFEQSNVGTSSPAKKNVLIVYAHHDNRNSLNAAFFKAARDVFTDEGDNVVVSDLYDMKFNPVLSKDDFLHEVGDKFNYLKETEKAVSGKTLAPDIIKEQEKITGADLIIFQCPMHWLGVPSILKGWFERVFSPPFAYSFKDGKLFNNGPMKDKRVLVSLTTGGNSTVFTPIGLLGDIEVLLWPLLNGILHFCGFQVLEPHVAHGAFLLEEGRADQLLEAWKNRLRNVWSETPRTYHPLESFEYSKGFQLRDDIINDKAENADKIPSTIGQHMNKPINSRP